MVTINAPKQRQGNNNTRGGQPGRKGLVFVGVLLSVIGLIFINFRGGSQLVHHSQEQLQTLVVTTTEASNNNEAQLLQQNLQEEQQRSLNLEEKAQVPAVQEEETAVTSTQSTPDFTTGQTQAQAEEKPAPVTPAPAPAPVKKEKKKKKKNRKKQQQQQQQQQSEVESETATTATSQVEATTVPVPVPAPTKPTETPAPVPPLTKKEKKKNKRKNNKNKNQPPPTKAPTSAPTKPRELTLEELEVEMHQERYRQLNESSVDDMLVWLASNRTPTRFRHLIKEFDHYMVPDKIEATALPPLDKRYQFFVAPDPLAGICQVAKMFTNYRQQYPNVSYPHVLFWGFHEDYGGMKDGVHKQWRRSGCKSSYIFDYVSHPDTLAAYTFQYHYKDHPKIHSLPLGYRFLKHGAHIHQALHNANNTPSLHNLRQKWLMFNLNLGHSKNRRPTLQLLQTNMARYNVTVKNTFSKQKLSKYYQEMIDSKFIASPFGLGRDCYRNYEALFLGCIPIIQKEPGREKDGWYRTFDDLPVAWISHWSQVTLPFLERTYRELLSPDKIKTYQWRKMTKSYWVQHIHGLFDAYNNNRADTTTTTATAVAR